MRYDKDIELYKRVKTPNGLGGFTKEDVLQLTIKGYATPIKIQTLFNESMLTTKQTIKIFTKDKSNDIDFKEIDFLKFDNVLYNVLHYADFGKVKMFEVEVNGNG